MKKLLAITMALAMILSLMSVATFTASADEAHIDNWSISYELVSATEVKITMFWGNSSTLTVPATIGGKKVVEIGPEACTGRKALTSVSLPEGLIKIGESAFYNCEKLTTINIPTTVTSIGAYFLSATAVQKIVIPSGVVLATYAFCGCSFLTDVTLPDDMTTLPHGLFAFCTNLESITLPDSLTSIEAQAFLDTSLRQITIPGNAKIQPFTFEDCYDLTDITFSKGVSEIPENGLYGCENLTSVTIPTSLYYIDTAVFDDCGVLQTVHYGGSKADQAKMRIRSYNDNLLNATWEFASGEESGPQYSSPYSFEYNYVDSGVRIYNFKGETNRISIPPTIDGRTVTIIASGTFDSVKDVLEDVTIPFGVNTILDETFSDYKQLTTITLPVNMKLIQPYAFSNCYRLKTVYYGGTEASREKMLISEGNYQLVQADWICQGLEPSEEPSKPADEVPGDATGDGSVDMKDVLTIRKTIAGLDGDVDKSAADVDGDGELTMKDVLMIRKFIAGLIDKLGK